MSSYLEGAVPARGEEGPVISSIHQLTPSALGEIRNWLENDPGRWQVQGTQLTGKLNGTIDVSQVTDAPAANSGTSSRTSGGVTTTSTSYVGLAGGPSLSGLTGDYLLIYGAMAHIDVAGAGTDRAFVSVVITGTASDADSASTGDDHFDSLCCVKIVTGLSGATATLNYRSGGGATAYFEGRWIVAVKLN